MCYIWHVYFGYFRHSAAHWFVHILWKVRIFAGDVPKHQGCFFSDILNTPKTCVTFDIFISYISDIQHLTYLCMLWKFHIFFRTFTWAPGLFSSDIPDTPRTCIRFGILIVSISDTQQLIYSCKSCWCSGSSALFQDMSNIQPPNLLGHISWFQTISCQIIGACSRNSTFFWDIYMTFRDFR